ncbi:MAG: O-antigen ligase family protein, partial [Clostridia bacterium]|nr:O-antigen ligase family protein [Clostridia bacterium]
AGGILIVGIIEESVMHEQIGRLFASLMGSFSTGSGRIYLWKQGLRDFCNSPLFGVGFFNPAATPGEAGYFEPVIANILPRMYHNTLIQFLGSCGIIGLFIYVFHRAQTVISFLNNITIERVFIAATMVALILVNLLDNHLFYILPTIIYATMLAMLSVTEKDTSSPKLRVARKIK